MAAAGITSSASLLAGSSAAHVIPSVGFKVVEEKVIQLAEKVNGAAQYVFKVQFNPTGNSQDPEAFIAEVPLHAPTITDALVMLHVFAEFIKGKNHNDFHEIMNKLKYSSVLFDSIPGNKDGDFKVTFSEYDAIGKRYKESHINTVVKGSVHKDLEKYAEVLAVTPANLTPTPAVHPQLSLTQTKAATSTSVDLTLKKTSDLPKDWSFHKEILQKHAKGEGAVEIKDSLGYLDEIFGDDFSSKVKGKTGEGLAEELYKEALNRIRQYETHSSANKLYSDKAEGEDVFEAFAKCVDYYLNNCSDKT